MNANVAHNNALRQLNGTARNRRAGPQARGITTYSRETRKSRGKCGKMLAAALQNSSGALQENLQDPSVTQLSETGTAGQVRTRRIGRRRTSSGTQSEHHRVMNY